jgi:hypothetical protein
MTVYFSMPISNSVFHIFVKNISHFYKLLNGAVPKYQVSYSVLYEILRSVYTLPQITLLTFMGENLSSLSS